MKKNDIAKMLYKQNPIAHFTHIKNGNAYYACTIDLDYEGTLAKGTPYNPENVKKVTFEVPATDMGEASFNAFMEAKLLRRWLV